MKAAIIIASLGAALAAPQVQIEALSRRDDNRSPRATSNGKVYTVQDVGSFTQALDLDFTKLKKLPASIQASSNTIAAGTAPFARRFMPSNVAVNAGGFLTLAVPGNQQSGPILSAEIQTTAKDCLYGSIRTVAMASTVPGTTHGFTFYSNDTQEADIAFLTDDNTQLHLTNEQTTYSSPITTFPIPAPSDATSAWHEYRMDWLPDRTMFYIDGQNVWNITTNVPSTPGFFLWNNWSNGNAWAKGPPIGTNVVKVQSIVAYFNRTSVVV